MAKVRVKPAKTCELIMAYPHLIEPQEFDAEDGEKPQPPKYNCVGIISPEQMKTKAYKAMVRMYEEVAKGFFNGIIPKKSRNPFRKCEEAWDEDEKTGKDIPKPGFMKGGLYISLNGGEEQPDIRDQRMRPITNASVLYPGCKFVAVVTAYGYNFKGNKGVSFGLRALQKCGEGENIAGRVKAEDYFDEIESDDEEDREDREEEEDEDEEEEERPRKKKKKGKSRPSRMDGDDDVEI
jgi:hypothetical protein